MNIEWSKTCNVRGGKVKEMMFGLYGVSILLFICTIHYFLSSKRPGVYPPRNILRKRSVSFALGAVIFLLLGSIFYYLT